jgi:hypothetical protein
VAHGTIKVFMISQLWPWEVVKKAMVGFSIYCIRATNPSTLGRCYPKIELDYRNPDKLVWIVNSERGKWKF